MSVPQDPQDPIRKQLVEARRAQILDAAASVIAAKGFHRATTREIATAAGVAEEAIDNYFEGKDDLLISMATRLADIGHLSVELAEALVGMGQAQPVGVASAVRAIQSTFVGMLVLRMVGDELLQARWDEMPEALGTIVFEGLNPVAAGVGR